MYKFDSICQYFKNLLKILLDPKLHEELWDEIGPI